MEGGGRSEWLLYREMSQIPGDSPWLCSTEFGLVHNGVKKKFLILFSLWSLLLLFVRENLTSFLPPHPTLAGAVGGALSFTVATPT